MIGRCDTYGLRDGDCEMACEELYSANEFIEDIASSDTGMIVDHPQRMYSNEVCRVNEDRTQKAITFIRVAIESARPIYPRNLFNNLTRELAR